MVHGSQKRTPNGAAPPTAGRVTNFAGTSAIAETAIDATRNIKPTSVGDTKDDARHSRHNNHNEPTPVGTRRKPAIYAGSQKATRIFTSHSTITMSQYNSLEKTERPYVNQTGRRRSYWTRVPITGNSSETEIFTYVEQAQYRESRKTTTDTAKEEPTKLPSRPTKLPPMSGTEHDNGSLLNHQQTRWIIQRIVKKRPGRPEFDEHELVAAPSPGNDDQKY